MHGFFSRNGESYEVSVNIDDGGKVVIAGSTAQTTDASDAELCPCPKCDQGRSELVKPPTPVTMLNVNLEDLVKMSAKETSQLMKRRKSLLKANQT